MKISSIAAFHFGYVTPSVFSFSKTYQSSFAFAFTIEHHHVRYAHLGVLFTVDSVFYLIVPFRFISGEIFIQEFSISVCIVVNRVFVCSFSISFYQFFSSSQSSHVFDIFLGDLICESFISYADYAAAQGAAVTPVQPGTVTSVSADALWGGVVEVTDAGGLVWRYCGLADPQVETGDEVSAADTLGKVGDVPAEAHAEAHVHLECLRDGVYRDPESSKP